MIDDKKDEIDLEKAGDEVDSLTDTSEFNTDIVTNMIKSSRIEIRLEAAYLLVKMRYNFCMNIYSFIYIFACILKFYFAFKSVYAVT